VAILVVLSATPNGAPRRTSGPTPAKAAPVRAAGEADYARFAQLSARDLVAMSDAELEAMDPLVMNMVVAKGLPELADIDFAKYAGIVDGWAERIAEGSRRGRPTRRSRRPRTGPIATFGEPGAWLSRWQAHSTTYLAILLAKRTGGDMKEALKKYGPKDASCAEYSDPVRECEKCLKGKPKCHGQDYPGRDDRNDCFNKAKQARNDARKLRGR